VPPDVYTVRGAAVVDVVAGSVLTDRSVVVRDGYITDVLDAESATPGKIIDAKGFYLCPGLIDTHVHLFLDGSDRSIEQYIASDDRARMDVAVRNAGVAIRAGITTVRDLGAPALLVFQLAEDADRGRLLAPHIVSCGASITRVDGHCRFFDGEVRTVGAVRRLVEWQLEHGARAVKLIASGGGHTPGTIPHQPELPLEFMRAAVEVARGYGARVTAHCHATEGLLRCIEAGVDTIEHVSFVEPPGRYRFDEEIAKRIRDHGISVSPTVTGALRYADRIRATRSRLNPGDVSALERLQGRLTNTAHFHRLGMKIVGGTDAGVTDTPFGLLVDEVTAYTQVGLSPAEALRTVTSDAATHLGLSRVGEVKPGYQADFTLLRADPLTDLGALRLPSMVFRSGALVYDGSAGATGRTASQV
jgi:imidazolonepropionase-like amidohydrolase